MALTDCSWRRYESLPQTAPFSWSGLAHFSSECCTGSHTRVDWRRQRPLRQEQENPASRRINQSLPKFSIPKNHNSKRSRPNRKGRRAAHRGSKVEHAYGPRVDRSEQGIQNTFVPAFNRPRFRGKLRYGATSLNFTSSTGLIGRYVFSANGIFDPNVTGGSLSPAGFSQLMTNYEHYVVTHSQMQVIFTNNGTTPALVALALHSDNVGSTDPNNMLELPFEQLVQLEPATAYGASKTLSMSANLSRFFGINVLQNSALYRGDLTSNPSEQAFYHCLCYGLKGGTADVYITVKIEYTAMFTEPRELTPSITSGLLALVLKDEERKRREQESSLLNQNPSSLRAQVVRLHK